MKTIILSILAAFILSGCSVGMALNDALEDFALYARDGYVDPCKKFPPTEDCKSGVFIPSSKGATNYSHSNGVVLPNGLALSPGTYRVKSSAPIGNSRSYRVSGPKGTGTYRVKSYSPIGNTRSYRVKGPKGTETYRIKSNSPIGNTRSYRVSGPNGTETYRVKSYKPIGNTRSYRVKGPNGTKTYRVKANKPIGNTQTFKVK